MPPPKKKPVSSGQRASPLISFTETGVYSNHIVVFLTKNELIIDFYLIGPELLSSPLMPDNQVGKMTHVQRSITPITASKGLATALANIVADFEADNNIVIPNSRTPMPDDKMTIWPNE